MMDGMVRSLQSTTGDVARIFLKEMKQLSQPQVSSFLALYLCLWENFYAIKCNILQGFNYFGCIVVDGRWSEDANPPCSIDDGSCGEYTVSQTLHCNNPTPSTGGRNCPCLTNVMTNCNGFTTTYTKDCNLKCGK